MIAQREPQHGYRNWTVIRCDHCRQEVSSGNGIENAMERMPAEAIYVEGEHTPPHYHYTAPLCFCSVECQTAYLEDA